MFVLGIPAPEHQFKVHDDVIVPCDKAVPSTLSNLFIEKI